MIGLKVLTLGTFDTFHDGHRKLIQRSMRLAEIGRPSVHVGVNSDSFVKAYKGRAPVRDEGQRRDDVSAELQTSINFFTTHINDGPGFALIRHVRPDLLVVGSDWLEKDYLEQIGMTPEELFEKLGVSLVFVPRTPGVSSSGLRR